MKLKFSKIIAFTAAFMLLAAPVVNALDYKDWLPLVPEKIGGLERQGDADGMNMEQSGQSWSAFEQNYSNGGENQVQLKIVSGSDAPGIRKFEALQKFNMETAEKKVKTLDVSGHKAVLELNKKGGKSNLIVSAGEQTIVIFSTSSFDHEEDIISLADEVPLDKIADAAK